MSARLILVRHGDSILDEQDRYSGTLQSPLSDEGATEVAGLAYCLALADTKIDFVFSSNLECSRQTTELIVHRIGCRNEVVYADELNERTYGELEGFTRTQALDRWGGTEVERMRGDPESPRDPLVSATNAFYRFHLRPKLQQGLVALVVSYDDNLRALVDLIDPEAPSFERGMFRTGAALDFRFAEDMSLVSRDLIHETRWGK